MKKLIEVKDGEGLEALIGEPVILMCMNYNYVGTLVGVNDDCVMLDEKDAAICYETGAWQNAQWADAQRVGAAIYVRTSSIEAFFRAAKSS